MYQASVVVRMSSVVAIALLEQALAKVDQEAADLVRKLLAAKKLQEALRSVLADTKEETK